MLVGLGIRWVSVWFICEFLVTSLYVKIGHGQGWDGARIDLMVLAGSLMLALAGAGALAGRGLAEAPPQRGRDAPDRL